MFAELMLSEALKTSEIEGAYFSREVVMSSLKVNLGINDFHHNTRNKKANATAQLMIEVQKRSNVALTEDLFLQWHDILMNAEKGISAGAFRTGTEPMQVFSGRYGDSMVHIEALRLVICQHSFHVSSIGTMILTEATGQGRRSHAFWVAGTSVFRNTAPL
ncbi:DUF4172 domain-containing protein [Chryseobacterium salipaludis]|nr:DUF4172 domain-containing protein [Chryseobacterium salipaludis]